MTWTIIVKHRGGWSETPISAPSSDRAWREFAALALALGLDWTVAEAFPEASP